MDIIESNINEKVELISSYEACCDKYRKLQRSANKLDFSLISILKFKDSVEGMLRKIAVEVPWQLQKIQSTAKELNAANEIKNLLTFMELYWQQSDFSNINDVSEHENKLKKFNAEYGEVLEKNLKIFLNEDFAPPRDLNDAFAFFVLDVLFLGLQNLMRQIFHVNEQYVLLADRYFQLGDFAKCNEYFVTIYQHFERAKERILGKNDIGLMNRIKAHFQNVRRFDACKQISKKLKFYEKVLTSATLPIFRDQPQTILKAPDFSKSKIQTPISSWEPDAKVSYAIQYQDGGFYSKFSEWSEPCLVAEHANPIIHLPVYIHQGKRLIFRKFDNKRPELVAVLEQPTQTFFHDIDRELYNAAGLIDQDEGIQQCKILLENGASPNALFEEGRSVIHAAAFAGNALLIESCLINDARIDLNAKDSQGYTALHIAAAIGYEELVQLLLEHGVNLYEKTYNDELTALHLAALKDNDSVLESLLAAESADPNIEDAEGFTPLHCAVLGGASAIEILIENSLVNVNAASKLWLTPLHVVVLCRNVDKSNALLRHSEVEVEFVTAGNLAAFHLAVILEDIQIIKQLLTKRVFNVNVKSSLSLTALHFAVSTKNENLVSELLKLRKIEINAELKYFGYTPLHIAARYNLQSIVTLLLEAGADINALTLENLTPLHVSAYYGCLKALKFLVDKNAKLNLKAWHNETALHMLAASSNAWASADKDLSVFKFLLEKGADINAECKCKMSLLHWAARGGNLNLIKFLVEQKNLHLNVVDNSGATPLFEAVKNKKMDVIEYFIEVKNMCFKHTNNSGKTVLHLAVKYNNFDVVKYLLERGAEISAVDGSERNLLHYAAECGNVDMIKFLLERKNFDLNAKDDIGRTALYIAAENRRFDAVKYFIGNKKISFDANSTKVLFRQTILNLAARNNDLDLLKYLLKNGADMYATDLIGMNSLHFAASNGSLDAIKFLVEQKNFDIFIEDRFGEIAVFYALSERKFVVVKYFVKSKKLNLKDKKELSDILLLSAAEYGNLDFVEYILENGADINFKDRSGMTLLHYAARRNNLDVIKFLVEQKNLDSLAKDSDGETPLFKAAMYGNLDVVRYFVKNKKMNFNEKNKNGTTAISEAESSGKHDTARFLRQIQKMQF